MEDRREHLLAEARRLLARGRAADALTTLGDAEALRPGADVRRLRAVARLLNRDFAGAWACYSAAGN